MAPITFTFTDKHRVHVHARSLNKASERKLPEPQRRGIWRVTGWLSEPITTTSNVEDLVLAQYEIAEHHRRTVRVVSAALAIGLAAVTCLVLGGAAW